MQELKTLLAQLNTQALKDVAPNLSLDALFECLHGTNRDQVEESGNILKKLFEAMEPSFVISQYKDQLHDGMKSDSEPIKQLSLTQIHRCVNTEKGSGEILNTSVELVYQCVLCIADKEISVAEEAIKILTCIGKSQAGLEFLFHRTLLQELKKVMQKSDIIRYRVYEYIVNVLQLSSQALEYCSNCGIIDQLVSELEGDDTLVQMNCIEMLSNIASCQHGLHYLDQQGITQKLETMMSSSDSDPMIGFLLPGLIKFFGSVAKFEPNEVFEKHPLFAGVVFSLLSTPDPTQKGVAIDTIGVVGSSVSGKLVLNKQGKVMEKAVQELGSAILQPPTEIRIRALAAITSLLQVKISEQTEDVLSITEKWFNAVHAKPIDTIISLCKQPFLEIRCGALSVIQSLANQMWGQRLLNDQPGLAEYLLDRSTEKDKIGKEMKYAVVQTLVESPTTGDVFGRPYLLRLKEYLRQGPFYVRVQSEVAMEGST
ncbi:26S proteasome non-ATPase regulatory subunit 5-like [Ptychodera flava]|uniref:26S proteasome non-ATPase regulatory subunit 5-like n=1 Tax=Ptychodera flava TaxID=63121 RepID=UPI00396A5F6A